MFEKGTQVDYQDFESQYEMPEDDDSVEDSSDSVEVKESEAQDEWNFSYGCCMPILRFPTCTVTDIFQIVQCVSYIRKASHPYSKSISVANCFRHVGKA